MTTGEAASFRVLAKALRSLAASMIATAHELDRVASRHAKRERRKVLDAPEGIVRPVGTRPLPVRLFDAARKRGRSGI